jgi:serine/threonine protein kinase
MSTPHLLNNRYRLDDRLGTGGMATVYRARDLMLERTVAIKVLRMDLSADPEFRELFKQEARAAANLSHPNIVTVHDFGLDEDQLFIVMENVPGTDLKTLLQQRKRFSTAESVALMVQACAGLGYAHRSGLVHCDVKPQNMLISPEMQLKVVDFGIARALASISPEESFEVVWGSPLYFSPEQAAGNAPSPASDVYSLGVVMFEMLCGQPPFNATTAEELARLHRDAPPPAMRSLNATVPQGIEQIVQKALAKQPEARYRTADQLGRDLVVFSQQKPLPGMEAPLVNSNAETKQVQPMNYTPAMIPVETNATIQLADRSSRRAGNSTGVDWATWLLALAALIAVGGLVPFGIWVYSNLFLPLP